MHTYRHLVFVGVDLASICQQTCSVKHINMGFIYKEIIAIIEIRGDECMQAMLEGSHRQVSITNRKYLHAFVDNKTILFNLAARNAGKLGLRNCK